MRIYFLFFIIVFNISLFAQKEEDSGYLTKQKIEIMQLKKEFNDFYNKKDKEYQERKKELETILAQVKKEKKEIEELVLENRKLLDEIQQTVQSKTAKIYNSMKPKIAAKIFDEMIEDGNFDDVFDIIMKLKEKNVTLLMKAISVQNAAKITEKLENYNIDDEINK